MVRACAPRILEALLPQAWRTASPGFAGWQCWKISFFIPFSSFFIPFFILFVSFCLESVGGEAFGQKVWRDEGGGGLLSAREPCRPWGTSRSDAGRG